jgi:parvulin-like peptidyl-prolyl isomerase
MKIQKTISTLVASSTLTLLTMPIGFAQTTASNDVLAQRGKTSVTMKELEAFAFAQGSEALKKTLRNPNLVLKTLEELLDAKMIDSVAPKDLSPAESAFTSMAIAQTKASVAQSIVEQRAKDKARGDRAVLEARAKELYLSADASSLKRVQSADFQHILFDLRVRPFSETAKRIEAAQKAIAAGDNFETLVTTYSDDPNAKQNLGRFENVSTQALEGSMSRVLFSELKPNETSAPITTRLGIHIVKLIRIREPEARPFDEIKDAMVNRLVEEAGAAARSTQTTALRSEETKFNDEALRKILLIPDAAAYDKAREISRAAAAEARKEAESKGVSTKQ